MNPHQQYTSELHAKFGYLATWAPNLILHLGDVGTLRDHVFEPVTTLSKLGIPFEKRDSQSPADYEYVSSDSVSMQFKAAGEAPTLGSALTATQAGITVQFGNESAVLFQAKKCQESTILGLDQLASGVIALHEKGEWPLEHVIVTSLVSAEAATILISSGRNGRVDLVGDTHLGTSGLLLADASLNLQIAHVSNVGTRIIAMTGLTPLFRASGLKTRLLRRPTLTRRGRTPPSAEMATSGPAVRFAEVGYTDFD